MWLKLLQPTLHLHERIRADHARLRISFLFYVALTFFLLLCTVCTYHSCKINLKWHECCKLRYARSHSHLLMKTMGFMHSPGPILLPRVSPIVRTFHSGFNGMLQSCQFGLKGQPICTLSHRPQSLSKQRERERKMNMPGLQLGMMNYIWDMQTIYLSAVHMAPAMLFCVPQCFMHVCRSAHFIRNGRSLVAYQFHTRPSQTRISSPVSCSVYSSANRLAD